MEMDAIDVVVARQRLELIRRKLLAGKNEACWRLQVEKREAITIALAMQLCWRSHLSLPACC